MTYLANLIFLWTIAIVIVGAQRNKGIEVSIGEAFIWALLVAFLSSFITFAITYYIYHYYVKEIRSIFLKEIDQGNDRIISTSQSTRGKKYGKYDRQPLREHSETNSITDMHEHHTQCFTARQMVTPRSEIKSQEDHPVPAYTEYPDNSKSILQLNPNKQLVLSNSRVSQILADEKGRPRTKDSDDALIVPSHDPMLKTSSDFNKEAQKPAKPKVNPDDRDLLESESYRTNHSQNTWLNFFLAVFLALCVGLSAAAMFRFENLFVRAVIIIVIMAYILDWILFRFLFIFLFSLFKYCRAKKYGYYSNKGIHGEVETKAAIRANELSKANSPGLDEDNIDPDEEIYQNKDYDNSKGYSPDLQK